MCAEYLYSLALINILPVPPRTLFSPLQTPKHTDKSHNASLNNTTSSTMSSPSAIPSPHTARATGPHYLGQLRGRKDITAEHYARLTPECIPYNDLPDDNDTEVRRELLKRGQHSDFTIFCEEDAFPVHQKFLAGASPYFRVLVSGGFLETYEEKATIKEASPIALAFLLLMIYQGYTVDMRLFKTFWRKKLTKWAKKEAEQEKENADAEESADEDTSMSPLQTTHWKEFLLLLECYQLADRFMLPERAQLALAKELRKAFHAALHRAASNRDYLNVSHCADLLAQVCQFCDDTGLDLLGHFITECFHHKKILCDGSVHGEAVLEVMQRNAQARCIWRTVGWCLDGR